MTAYSTMAAKTNPKQLLERERVIWVGRESIQDVDVEGCRVRHLGEIGTEAKAEGGHREDSHDAWNDESQLSIREDRWSRGQMEDRQRRGRAPIRKTGMVLVEKSGPKATAGVE